MESLQDLSLWQGLIPIIIPVLLGLIKKYLKKTWIPFIAAIMGIGFSYLGVQLTGDSLTLVETVLNGIALGIFGVGIREVAKHPFQFFAPPKKDDLP